MTRTVGAAILTASLLVGGCRAAAPTNINTQDPYANIDLLEATFRHMFKKNASGGQSNVAAYCISIGKSKSAKPIDPALDAPAKLLSRLANESPKVLPGSSCIWNDVAVVEAKSKEPALLFSVTKIDCASASKCNVEGGYLEGNLSASGNSFVVERGSSGWTVTSDQMNWIS
jgi:hypothetical protein